MGAANGRAPGIDPGYPLNENGDGMALNVEPGEDSVRIDPLRDVNQFNAVSLDREVHTLVWPSGADFDPATLHDWPEHEAGMLALAQRWAAAGGDKKATG